MLKKSVPLVVAVALAALLTPSQAGAYGAAHVGYTHVGPNGVYHAGATEVHAGYGGASGGAYHAGSSGAYGGAYHAGYGGAYGGAAGGYHYTAGYSGGAAYGGYHYGYVR
jgi:hypothetical protein